MFEMDDLLSRIKKNEMGNLEVIVNASFADLQNHIGLEFSDCRVACSEGSITPFK